MILAYFLPEGLQTGLVKNRPEYAYAEGVLAKFSPQEQLGALPAVKRYDQHVIARMASLFVFFAVVFFGLYWTSRVARALDSLLEGGQRLSMLVEYIALLSPASFQAVLSITAFASAIYVAERLLADNELIVLQGAGLNPTRLLAPTAAFGAAVAAISALLAHEIVPSSKARLDQLNNELSSDLAARRIAAGYFFSPTTDLVLFINEISPDGIQNDVFIYDARNPDKEAAYFADSAILSKGESKSFLSMTSGQTQELDTESLRLSKLTFAELKLDLSVSLERRTFLSSGLASVVTRDAIFLLREMDQLSEAARHGTVVELHERFSEPLYAFLFPLIGVASILLSGALKIGRFWGIVFSCSLMFLIFVLANFTEDLTREDLRFWPLMYMPAFLSAAFLMPVVVVSSRMPETPGALAWLSSRSR